MKTLRNIKEGFFNNIGTTTISDSELEAIDMPVTKAYGKAIVSGEILEYKIWHNKIPKYFINMAIDIVSGMFLKSSIKSAGSVWLKLYQDIDKIDKRSEDYEDWLVGLKVAKKNCGIYYDKLINNYKGVYDVNDRIYIPIPTATILGKFVMEHKDDLNWLLKPIFNDSLYNASNKSWLSNKFIGLLMCYSYTFASLKEHNIIDKNIKFSDIIHNDSIMYIIDEVEKGFMEYSVGSKLTNVVKEIVISRDVDADNAMYDNMLAKLDALKNDIELLRNNNYVPNAMTNKTFNDIEQRCTVVARLANKYRK